MEIVVSPTVQEKLERGKIRVEDAQRAVLHCEESGQRFGGGKPDCFIGCLKTGYVTYWVEYQRVKDDTCVLISAYSHRISIDDEGTAQRVKFC